MNVKVSPIKVTITIHFVPSIDPTERYPLAAFAEFLTKQRLESTLFEAIIESPNDVLVEAYCGEKHAYGNGTNRFQRSTTKTRTAVTTGEHEFSLGCVEDTAASREFFDDLLQRSTHGKIRCSVSVTASGGEVRTIFGRDRIFGGHYTHLQPEPFHEHSEILAHGARRLARCDRGLLPIPG